MSPTRLQVACGCVTSNQTSRPLLGVDELAVYLGTSVRHIRRLVAKRRVPFFKVGYFVRFRPDEIDVWLERDCRGGAVSPHLYSSVRARRSALTVPPTVPGQLSLDE